MLRAALAGLVLVIVIVFVIVMASIGVGVLTYSHSQAILGEIAGQMARGVSRRQLAMLLCSEGIIISMVGIGVGLVSGTIPPYLYTLSIAKADEIAISPAFVLPSGFVTLSAAFFLALLITSLLVSLDASRTRLDRALRGRF